MINFGIIRHGLPVEVIPVDVGIEMVVVEAWEMVMLVPEGVAWTEAPPEAPGAVTVGWAVPTNAGPCVVRDTVGPELAV